MSKRIAFAPVAVALAVALAGAACGEAGPTPTAATGQAEPPTPAATPSPTVEPTSAPPSAAPMQTPTATSTPTPTAMPTPTAAPEGQPSLSPGDADAEKGCSQTPGVDSYDVSSVATGPDIHWVYSIRVSGEDYYMQVNMIKPEGITTEFIGLMECFTDARTKDCGKR